MTPYMMDLRFLIVAAIFIYLLLSRGQSGKAAIVNLRISVIHLRYLYGVVDPLGLEPRTAPL